MLSVTGTPHRNGHRLVPRARLAVLTGAIAALAIGLHSALPSDYPNLDALPEFTENGEEYQHHPERRVTENGHFVWTEVAWGELSAAWRHAATCRCGEGPVDSFSPEDCPRTRSGSRLSLARKWRPHRRRHLGGGMAGAGRARRWNRMCFNWGQWLDGVRSGNASLLARQVYQSTAWSAIGTCRAPT